METIKNIPVIEFPVDNNIPTEKLSAVFNEVTNSYKFYWFLAILDALKNNNNDEILFKDLFERMLSKVWYTLDYYKLSLGIQDSFINIIKEVNSKIKIDNGINSENPIIQIQKGFDKKSLNVLNKKISTLVRWVPTRFIRPFFNNDTKGLIDAKVDNAIINLAKTSFENKDDKCPYYFLEDRIVLNKNWKAYFLKNSYVIEKFIERELITFLHKNNPNVIGISEKLAKPFHRKSLSSNFDSWKYYLTINHDAKDIYSNEIIPVNFSMDHFIPWSYTVHDLNWNFVPTSKSINSKKSDNLPSLPKYLDKFTELQYDFFHTISNEEKLYKITEQYVVLFNLDVNGILEVPKHNFKKKIEDTIIPMEQIARNMGFPNNWIL